jgi:putative lipoic acid-binding regulatory protein
MILGSNNKRPSIDYPCDWDYKIIGSDAEKILEAINEAIEGTEYDVRPSNISNSGKYCSLNLKVRVVTEEERDFIFSKLSNHKDVIMVI